MDLSARIANCACATQRCEAFPPASPSAPMGKRWTANVWGQSITQSDLRDSARCCTKFGSAPISPRLARTSAPRSPPTKPPSPNARRRSRRREVRRSISLRLRARRRAQSRLYVSLWAQAAVIVIRHEDARDQGSLGTSRNIRTRCCSANPAKHLFVANANRNSVSVDRHRDRAKLSRRSLAELQPDSPPGSTPNSLALLAGRKAALRRQRQHQHRRRLRRQRRSARAARSASSPWAGIPPPCASLPDGKQLLVANGKGLISKANRYGPQPGNDAPGKPARIHRRPVPRHAQRHRAARRRDASRHSCKRWTATGLPLHAHAALQCDRPRARQPHPARVGDPSPIKYCIYIIKENRTYDQVFGDMPEGNGDPTLCLFPEKHHAQSSQARARVRAARQLLRRERSQRRRPRMDHGRLRHRLRRENLAAQLRPQPTQEISLPRRGQLPDRHARRRLPLGPRPRSRRELPQLRRVRQQRQDHQRPRHFTREGAARPFRSLVPRLRHGLSRRETRRPLHLGTAAVRARRRNAAAANRPPAQRPHLRHHRRQADAHRLRRRQRPRLRHG